MHVSSIEIRNVRAFTKLRWNLQPRQLRGWHVVIGDNGSGKSTFLRALALVLTGPKDAQALREDWSTWCRKGKGSSSIHVTVQGDSKWDKWAGRGKQTGDPSGGIVFSKASDGEVRLNQPQTGQFRRIGPASGPHHAVR
jgi:recombinational DNA repair ATPase RecF